MMGSKAFESPLISHVRMRAMYRALVETRLLAQRAGRGSGLAKGMEACWVGTAIDLREGDLVSVPGNAWLPDYVRAVGTREKARAASRAEAVKAVHALADRVTSRASGLERLLVASGMARAVKAAGNSGAVAAYVGAAELSAAEWKRALTVAMDGDLPLMIVATPAKGAADISDVVKRMGVKTIPVIPVDAGDAVAIYRVTQETLVRARADGGVAVIECVDCRTDPVRLLGAQLVKKKICTERWVTAVEPVFRATLGKV
jgi:TPP-dependent pyruvate/acetoin dehydrogenase alpha subunit